MSESKQLARILKVLAVDTRVRIVQLLKGRALCVNALAARLGVTQGAVSQHLRIMRDAGLVIDRKHGYFVHYELNERTLAQWREAIGGLLDTSCARPENVQGAKPCVAMTRKIARNRKT
ncbi:MAG TPA: metalloregulator ArsR/SmtB family transcription factor [Planctomycetota bacterium]|nr:metalloregulator ArsR/SmtB family transcription factor [Planctomycetota bacterium]